jgi:hypothetical protein
LDTINSLDKFRVPLGNQEIELQDLGFAGGNMNLLRLRIRERSRFTIFDIDPVTAKRWAVAMLQWAEAQDVEGADTAGGAEPVVE